MHGETPLNLFPFKVENFLREVKRKTWIVTIFLVIPVAVTFAAFDTESGNTRSQSLGGCVCGDMDPLTSVQGNPAGLSGAQWVAVELGYRQLFNLADLTITTFSLAYPVVDGGMGLAIQSFGNDIYREVEAEISYGRSIGYRVSIGATLAYHWLTISNYGSDGDVSLSLGIQAQPIHNLVWGLWARNLTEGEIGDSGDPLPQETITGVSYRILNRLQASFDLSKDPRYPETYKFGTEVFLNQYIVTRAGMQYRPNRASVGFGILWQGWQLDYGALTHQELGWTHCISLRWGRR